MFESIPLTDDRAERLVCKKHQEGKEKGVKTQDEIEDVLAELENGLRFT